MPSGLMRRGPWALRVLISQIIMPLLANLSQNGQLRTTKKSASDVLEVAFNHSLAKGAYLNGLKPAEMSLEANDRMKQKTLWADTIRYSSITEEETSLENWA